MTAAVAPQSLHASWTRGQIALWGWDGNRGLGGPALRRVCAQVLGAWWPEAASYDGGAVLLPDPETGKVRERSVNVLQMPARLALESLYQRYPTPRWSPSVRWFHAATQLAVQAAATGRVLPTLQVDGLRWQAEWALIDEPELDAALNRLEHIMPPVVTGSPGSEDATAHGIVSALADAACRWTLLEQSWRPPLNRSRSAPVIALRRVTTGLTVDPEVLAATPAHESIYSALSAAMGDARGAAEGGVPTTSRARLVPPDEAGDPWLLAFELQSLDDPTLVAPWGEVWAGSDDARKVVDGGALGPVRRRITALVERLSHVVPALDELATLHQPDKLEMSSDEVELFLDDGLDLAERLGVSVLMPAGLAMQRPRMKARARPAEPGGPSANLGQAMVDIDWGLVLGDEELTPGELEELAEAKAGLVHLRGSWVRVDTDQIKGALDGLSERRRDLSTVTAAQLLRVSADQLLSEAELEEIDRLEADEASVEENAGLSVDGWLADLLEGLPDERLEEVVEPETFVGELRPYQRRALGWMGFLRRLGLGGCLADDMGLGKTPTTLAHLVNCVGERPALVVCPLSVVHNWEAEAARFTPHLRTLIIHGPDRPRDDRLVAEINGHDLAITTYGTLSREVDALGRIDWEVVVCDEAQFVKNHRTKAARAVRALPARQVMALTGTPIENRLTELWAILDAANPGMLGGVTWFRETFASPIENRNDPAALEALQRLTGPFLLRRTKADRSLVPDLPDKVEQHHFATLTKEQAGLYKAVVDDFLTEAERSDGMARRGLVLATLTRLKQICNHPLHFLSSGAGSTGPTGASGKLTKRSGKLERFDELVTELLDADEQALVFTQYREMGLLLARHLYEQRNMEASFLHGGVSKKKRDQMVARFQAGEGAPLQLVSLKAGGTGLNLTAASRVIHYDRWWNPAVEDQATDRAWRIGQKSTVFVHKLVCQGTLEERIDALLTEKRALADSVVGSGENWLTEMSTDELRDLLVLDATAVISE